MEANDMKAMREALELAIRVLSRNKADAPYRAWGEYDNAIKECKAAVAAPPRNCDVGTAKEQNQRMHKFCVKYGLYKGFSDKYKCDNCPLLYTLMDNTRCELAWAQMPYESEVGK